MIPLEHAWEMSVKYRYAHKIASSKKKSQSRIEAVISERCSFHHKKCIKSAYLIKNSLFDQCFNVDSVIAWKSKKTPEFRSRLMNFNSEKIGYKNSTAHELLSKKYATFFTIHGQKWCQIFEPIKMLDVIFGHET